MPDKARQLHYHSETEARWNHAPCLVFYRRQTSYSAHPCDDTCRGSQSPHSGSVGAVAFGYVQQLESSRILSIGRPTGSATSYVSFVLQKGQGAWAPRCQAQRDANWSFHGVFPSFHRTFSARSSLTWSPTGRLTVCRGLKCWQVIITLSGEGRPEEADHGWKIGASFRISDVGTWGRSDAASVTFLHRSDVICLHPRRVPVTSKLTHRFGTWPDNLYGNVSEFAVRNDAFGSVFLGMNEWTAGRGIERVIKGIAERRRQQ